MILVVHAHPYPAHSRACGALLEGIRTLPGTEVRSLYETYPDFDIDAEAEQQALRRADLVVLLHPFYWYGPPALLKHWFDKVLERGLVQNADPCQLKGKRCLWVTTVGDDEATFIEGGDNGAPFERYAAPLAQTARFTGMVWEPPFVVFGAQAITADALAEKARLLRQQIESCAAAPRRRAVAVPAGAAS